MPPLPQREKEERYVSPETVIEKALAEIWQEVLQIESVGITDDFFALVGNSLLAITLISKMQKYLNIEDDYEKLPLSVILTDPTIAKLTRIIEKIGSVEYEPIVRMTSEVLGTPLFLVHAARVDPICYQYLTSFLEGKVTTYVIRTHELEEGESVEKTARYNIEKMKSVQPEGPYLFGGMCMGGLVAYEMAYILRKQGEEVKLAFMMDTVNIPGKEDYKTVEMHQKARF